MKGSKAAVLALAAVATADPAEFLNANYDISQGEPFTLKYTNCDNGVCSMFLWGFDIYSEGWRNFWNITYHAPSDEYTVFIDDMDPGEYCFRIDNPSGIAYSPLINYTVATPTPTIISSIPTLFSTASTTLSLPSSTAPTPVPIHTSTTAPVVEITTQSSEQDTGGLTTGGKAGVAMASLAVVSIGLGLAILWWRKKMRWVQKQGLAHEADASGAQRPMLDAEHPLELPADDILSHDHDTEAKTPRTYATYSGEGRLSLPVATPKMNNEKRHFSHFSVSPYEYEVSYGGESRFEAPYELDAQQQTLSNLSSGQVYGAHPPQPQQAEEAQESVAFESNTKTSANIVTLGHVASEESAQSQHSDPQSLSIARDEELWSLERQYAELESRRQRILDLETIEREQAVLRKRLTLLQERNGTPLSLNDSSATKEISGPI